MHFQALVVALQKYLESNDVNQLQLINMYKSHITNDILTAFNLSEPLIHHHLETFQNSPSFLSFLLQIIDLSPKLASLPQNGDNKRTFFRTFYEKLTDEPFMDTFQEQDILNRIESLKRKYSQLQQELTTCITEKQKISENYSNLQTTYGTINETLLKTYREVFQSDDLNVIIGLQKLCTICIELIKYARRKQYPEDITDFLLKIDTLQIELQQNLNSCFQEKIKLSEEIAKLQSTFNKIQEMLPQTLKDVYPLDIFTSLQFLCNFYTEFMNYASKFQYPVDIPQFLSKITEIQGQNLQLKSKLAQYTSEDVHSMPFITLPDENSDMKYETELNDIKNEKSKIIKEFEGLKKEAMDFFMFFKERFHLQISNEEEDTTGYTVMRHVLNDLLKEIHLIADTHKMEDRKPDNILKQVQPILSFFQIITQEMTELFQKTFTPKEVIIYLRKMKSIILQVNTIKTLDDLNKMYQTTFPDNPSLWSSTLSEILPKEKEEAKLIDEYSKRIVNLEAELNNKKAEYSANTETLNQKIREIQGELDQCKNNSKKEIEILKSEWLKESKEYQNELEDYKQNVVEMPAVSEDYEMQGTTEPTKKPKKSYPKFLLLRNKLSEVQKSEANLKRELTTKKQEYFQIQIQLADKERTLVEKDKEISLIQSNLNTLQSKLEEYEKTISTLKKQLTDQEQQKMTNEETLKNKLKECQETLTAMQQHSHREDDVTMNLLAESRGSVKRPSDDIKASQRKIQATTLESSIFKDPISFEFSQPQVEDELPQMTSSFETQLGTCIKDKNELTIKLEDCKTKLVAFERLLATSHLGQYGKYLQECNLLTISNIKSIFVILFKYYFQLLRDHVILKIPKNFENEMQEFKRLFVAWREGQEESYNSIIYQFLQNIIDFTLSEEALHHLEKSDTINELVVHAIRETKEHLDALTLESSFKTYFKQFEYTDFKTALEENLSILNILKQIYSTNVLKILKEKVQSSIV